ncbi:DUF2834 domain-containing protein [Pseudomonas sp. Irchel 3E13]|uniref:DUF2834 domain-containing protein n=1 Tax=Pseudomonas sp. Irchel 3E13 TaxID=2008975 RepID=UPI000BA3CF27|nr:DUF2834 domain-containing protein [Pseudomonas sp. Irchel 3E13]
MNKPWLALITLLAFTGYTLYSMSIAEQSLLQFGVQLMSSPDTAQVVIDLYIMAGLACAWMAQDARAKGRSLLSVLPYFLLTAVFVSIGPLLYLVINGFRHSPAAHRTTNPH